MEIARIVIDILLAIMWVVITKTNRDIFTKKEKIIYYLISAAYISSVVLTLLDIYFRK